MGGMMVCFFGFFRSEEICVQTHCSFDAICSMTFADILMDYIVRASPLKEIENRFNEAGDIGLLRKDRWAYISSGSIDFSSEVLQNPAKIGINPLKNSRHSFVGESYHNKVTGKVAYQICIRLPPNSLTVLSSSLVGPPVDSQDH